MMSGVLQSDYLNSYLNNNESKEYHFEVFGCGRQWSRKDEFVGSLLLGHIPGIIPEHYWSRLQNQES